AAARYAGALAAAGLLACTGQMTGAPAGHPRPRAAGQGAVREVSRGCAGSNSEPISAAAGPAYVYVVWIGCGGIGFARSADGGAHFGKATLVPGSRSGTTRSTWDPSVAVARDGTLYVAYMLGTGTHSTPVVDVSTDHGATFPRVHQVAPDVTGNFGDRDFIAVGPSGKLFMTWDYGPDSGKVKIACAKHGSCYFTTGDLNAVIQSSSDGGRSWSKIIPLAPGFPRNGGISAPVLVQPDGRVDVLFWGHRIGRPPGDKLHAGHEFFTSSAGGRTWSRHPLELFPGKGAISLPTWWIDGNLSTDPAGTLYATWDTQSAAGDVAWMTWSANHGKSWSAPVRVAGSPQHAMHLVQSAGTGRGVADIAWQTSASPKGYATYVRPFSIRTGWLGPAIRVSPRFGNPAAWPGDTLGFAHLRGRGLSVAWGSAVGTSRDSEIWATVVH
ncbi:MAG: hypothetical protein ACR2FU_07505, partial [Streptosporangiaceae bacterium]